MQSRCVALFAAALVLASGCQPSAPTAATTAKETPSPSGSPFAAQQNVRQAVKRTANLAELTEFAKAYVQANLMLGRAPSRLEDLKDSLGGPTYKAFQEGVYVVNWNVANPSSNTILAYGKDADSYGTRLVARGDGSAARLSADEFRAAVPGK